MTSHDYGANELLGYAVTGLKGHGFYDIYHLSG